MKHTMLLTEKNKLIEHVLSTLLIPRLDPLHRGDPPTVSDMVVRP